MTVVMPEHFSENDKTILKEAGSLESALLESQTYTKAIKSYIAECKEKKVEPTIWDFAKRAAYITSGSLKGLLQQTKIMTIIA